VSTLGHEGGSGPKPLATSRTVSSAHYTNGHAGNGAAASVERGKALAKAAPGDPVNGAATLKYRVEEVNRALVGLVGRPRTVLDVGCGVGLNGAAFKRTGARVTGIEIVPRSIERARAVLDEVVSADITSDADVRDVLGQRRFDLIVFADVLEHTVEPRAVIERFLPYLEDDGQILVSLPNVAAWTVRLGLLAGRFDYQPSGILDDTHLRFFTRDSAARLCESAGLEVLCQEQNPMLVRAAKDLILKTWVRESSEPTDLSESFSYKAYQAFVRPLEDLVASRAPGLFAFQNVILARKRSDEGPHRKMSLTVGMLTMDEEESIEKMIGEIRSVAPDAKILCVDSSTKDRTPEIARRLGARVLRQVPPRGHGPAMELLMYSAAKESDMLIYLDCDFTYPSSMIPVVRRLIEEEGVDLVNCARTRTRPAAMPVPNYLANRGFAALAHLLHGVPTCDVHSGMRGYRTGMIRAFDFDGEGDAVPIDTLLWPAKCGYHVVELPIEYHERVGQSKLRKLAGTVWTMIRLVKSLPVGRRRGERFEVR
jgi:2-polyprenyl-3-methyl-5-hydroxy-6-metoxy-1,4-benzoquinol methylase